MYLPIEKIENANSPVYETQSILFASAVCDSLEMAGIPARLHQNGRISVEVTAEAAADSQRLLFCEPRYGEIFGLRG
jgi:hypothetical protein